MDARGTGDGRGVNERLDEAASVPPTLVRRQDVDMQVGREIIGPGEQHALGPVESLQHPPVPDRHIGRRGGVARDQPGQPFLPVGAYKPSRVGGP